MGNYETLNELLVTLFRDVMDIEQKVIITPEFKDITNNDMHVIEAIGIGEPKNMSSIARELSVTVGTLTIAMNSLVKKGYVERSRGLEDRRVVYISLSEHFHQILRYSHRDGFFHSIPDSCFHSFQKRIFLFSGFQIRICFIPVLSGKIIV